MARRGISPAAPAQRAKVRGELCIVCRQPASDPAHLVDRSLGGCDAPECVVPLCRRDHTAYDLGQLDLLPFLEPDYRAEQQHAVSHVGIERARIRITNCRRLAA